MPRLLQRRDRRRRAAGAGRARPAGVARAFILAARLRSLGALLGVLTAPGSRGRCGGWLQSPLGSTGATFSRASTDADAQGNEIRVLADAFNHMLDRLTEAFAGQRAFVADASHELRTPLTVIRGQLEVLAAQENLRSRRSAASSASCRREVARMSRLVDDLLLLARAEQASFCA